MPVRPHCQVSQLSLTAPAMATEYFCSCRVAWGALAMIRGARAGPTVDSGSTVPMVPTRLTETIEALCIQVSMAAARAAQMPSM